MDHIDTMYDRTGNLDLVTLMGLTYANGLPIYASNPAVQAHTVHAIKTIMSELAYGSRSEEFKRKTLARLVDAARACQAEQARECADSDSLRVLTTRWQGRVIDAVYGVISGRDSSLKEQVLRQVCTRGLASLRARSPCVRAPSVVDAMKDLVMENLVHKLNPDAWKQGDDIPQRQVPHITSSYRVAVGARLGLRGIESAKMDHCKFAVSDGDAARIVTAFERMFVIDELCDLLVNDVNQQAADADRLIDRDLLAKWAGNVDENGGFDSHTVFYDEDNAALYKDVGKPRPENAYQPFLHRVVALQLLRALFFPEPKRFKTAAE